MPYENTLALLISVRRYMEKADDIEECKEFVDMLIASMTDEKKIEEIADKFADLMKKANQKKDK